LTFGQVRLHLGKTQKYLVFRSICTNFVPKFEFTPILYMKELALKYGCNPNQKPSRIFMTEGELPIEVINGRPGYINFLDALNAWQLVKELKAATGLPAAASFKHVSPAGAAVGLPLSDTLKKIYFVDDIKGLDESQIACAYARARGADRMSSYGDFVALSDTCDATTALLLKREVSDGVIAPDYTAEAIEILKDKRKGTYNVIKIAPTYKPAPIETKQCFGVTFEQGRNEIKLDDPALFENIPTQNKTFSADAKRDLIIALITLKYTQSNSVCYVKDGQAIGIGAGQQSRIHCTRLAGNKADIWWLRQHPKVMALPFKEGIRRADRDNTIDVYISEDEHDDVLRDGAWQQFFTEQPEVLTMAEKKEWIAKNTKVALGSDAFFPFGDNIERAHKSGVEFIAQAGGSVRDDHVIMTCDKYGIAMAFTGVRLFHH
jgi:phosphoribosylaminoimidazolecarboxamide formyltransferase/IMP cyclohydrolase